MINRDLMGPSPQSVSDLPVLRTFIERGKSNGDAAFGGSTDCLAPATRDFGIAQHYTVS